MGRALHLGNNRNRALAPLAGAGALRRFRAAGQSEKTHTQHAVRAAVLILRHHHGIGEVSNDERPSSAVPELLSLVFPRGVQGASNQVLRIHLGHSHTAHGFRRRQHHGTTHDAWRGRYLRNAPLTTRIGPRTAAEGRPVRRSPTPALDRK
ncbi:hypothetical protein T484DRAFT_2026866 [Baffinella frigidus]|nr:hypothetical protein T484DRAFT_2026866 [Cryptophyta sp. CCMP2293]